MTHLTFMTKKIRAAFCLALALLPAFSISVNAEPESLFDDENIVYSGSGDERISFKNAVYWANPNHTNDNYDAILLFEFNGYSRTVTDATGGYTYSKVCKAVEFTHYISEYFMVKKSVIAGDVDDLHTSITTENIDGKQIEKVSIRIAPDSIHDNIKLGIPLILKDEYRMPLEDTNYYINYDNDLSYGSTVEYETVRNRPNSQLYEPDESDPDTKALACQSTYLTVPGVQVELSFDRTKYTMPRGELLDKRELLYTLKLNGKTITDENILKNIEFGFKNYGNFKYVTDLVVAEATDYKHISGVKSGVSLITASYMGHTSSNDAAVIIPGDVSGDGYVSISDASLMASALRRTFNVSKDYLSELCDCNCDGHITIADVSIITSMIRGKADYNNSYR